MRGSVSREMEKKGFDIGKHDSGLGSVHGGMDSSENVLIN